MGRTAWNFKNDRKYRAARSRAIEIMQGIRLPYHNVEHALHVEKYAVAIAVGEGVSESNLALLSLAAVFHDTGYSITHENHEMIGAVLAEAAMKAAGYAGEDIESVKDMIVYGTTAPQKPRNILEKILADADPANVGTADFLEFNELLREEFRVEDRLDWLKRTLAFVELHVYFTKTAREMFGQKQASNLEELRGRILVLEGSKRPSS